MTIKRLALLSLGLLLLAAALFVDYRFRGFPEQAALVQDLWSMALAFVLGSGLMLASPSVPRRDPLNSKNLELELKNQETEQLKAKIQTLEAALSKMLQQ